MRLPDGAGGEVVLLLIGRPTALCGVVCEEIAGLIARVAADNAKRAGALAWPTGQRSGNGKFWTGEHDMATADELSEAFDLNSKISDLEERVRILERSVPQPAHDFGGVTSTGEAKPMKRWVVTRGRWEVFSRDHGFIRRGVGVGKAGCVQPWYAASLDDARGVVELLKLVAVGIEEIEVAQREDGMLVEALYA